MSIATTKMKIIVVIFLVIVGLDSKAMADGSLPYEDLLAKFPDENLTFSMLEQSLKIFKGDVMAEIRVLSDHPNKRFGGMRLGPYYACAKQKYGKHKLVLVTFVTENIYFDRNKRVIDDFDKAFYITEKLIGVHLEESNEMHSIMKCYDRDLPHETENK